MTSLFNYPPTEQQLGLLLSVGMPSETGLLLLRLFTLLVWLGVLIVWYRIVAKLISGSVALVSSILLWASPSVWVLVWSYPILVIKFALVLVIIYFFNISWKTLLVLTIVVAGINIMVLKQSPAVLSKIKMGDAKAEVGARFMAEDSLRIRAELPLWWRRIGYNKYFIVYKELIAEVLPYFDLETVYFQEVHPMEQKSVVMFYWSSVILLIAGVHFVFQKRTLKSASVITGLFLVSLVDYVFSNSVVYQRLLLIMLPLSIIMAIGLLKIWQSRTAGAVISLVLLYGVYTNIYDMSMRADFWLDNRPLVYEFWYKNLKVYSENNVVNRIRVSTLIGNSRNYCQFYFGSECDSDKFVFDSFDLSVGVKEKGVYLGFAGEFVGPKFKNDIDPLWDSVASSNGIRIVSKKNIRDTVAYRYGNDIGLGEVK